MGDWELSQILDCEVCGEETYFVIFVTPVTGSVEFEADCETCGSYYVGEGELIHERDDGGSYTFLEPELMTRKV